MLSLVSIFVYFSNIFVKFIFMEDEFVLFINPIMDKVELDTTQ